MESYVAPEPVVVIPEPVIIEKPVVRRGPAIEVSRSEARIISERMLPGIKRSNEVKRGVAVEVSRSPARIISENFYKIIECDQPDCHKK